MGSIVEIFMFLLIFSHRRMVLRGWHYRGAAIFIVKYFCVVTQGQLSHHLNRNWLATVNQTPALQWISAQVWNNFHSIVMLELIEHCVVDLGDPGHGADVLITSSWLYMSSNDWDTSSWSESNRAGGRRLSIRNFELRVERIFRPLVSYSLWSELSWVKCSYCSREWVKEGRLRRGPWARSFHQENAVKLRSQLRRNFIVSEQKVKSNVLSCYLRVSSLIMQHSKPSHHITTVCDCHAFIELWLL